VRPVTSETKVYARDTVKARHGENEGALARVPSEGFDSPGFVKQTLEFKRLYGLAGAAAAPAGLVAPGLAAVAAALAG